MKRVDSFPTNSINGVEYCAGHVLPFGATLGEGAVNFSIFSRDATACTLLLYHSGEEEPFVRIPFPKEFRIGNVFSMQVFDLDIEDVEYAYLMDGPNDPKLGLLFDPTMPLLDPYAKSVSGRTTWGKKTFTEAFPSHLDDAFRHDIPADNGKKTQMVASFGHLDDTFRHDIPADNGKKTQMEASSGHPDDAFRHGISTDNGDTAHMETSAAPLKKAHFRGKVIHNDYDWEGDRPPEIPLGDLVIYEAHVRGFTAHKSSKVRRPGTYVGLREKIPYLKALGVNCIELLPIFEFDELENPRKFEGKPLYNYWGYSTVCFFAPKAGYSALGKFGLEADELKALIRELHANGIEVLLDVVFNHTAEGNEDGPVISYKGIDNRTYYLLAPGGGYFNFSGCGNTMNCNNAVV
ncbi:MAG: alpha-amylase family glycosyl hydrolase, partial [Lachnospiraceae bacterium]|nr:alpha-amylase family glycosyl hydrolase [Lachnospiraceae bacterium]